MNKISWNLLLKVMDEKQITRYQLANKIGVTTTTVYRYFQGTREPRHDIVYDIAKALELTIEEIKEIFFPDSTDNF